MLDAPTPAVLAVHDRSTAGLIGEVKARADAETFEVTPDTRDGSPGRLVDRIENDTR